MTAFRTIVFFIAGASLARSAPVLSGVEACDVSPRGVRVIWQSDIAAEPSLGVFTDAAGTVAAPGAVTASYTGVDDYTKLLLSNSGLMSVDVSGLAADTIYYLRPSARSLANSSVTSAPLVSIRTATASAASAAVAPFVAVANPVVRFTCLSPSGDVDAETGILLARVTAARTPVSAAVRDEGTVYLDMGNLVSSSTGLTLPTSGGEPLTLDFYRGFGKVERFSFFMPASDGLGTVQDPRLTAGPLTATQVRGVSGTEGLARIFMEFPAVAGKFYEVESSPTLAPGTWSVVDTGILATESRLFWEDNGLATGLVPPSDVKKRFYRLVPFVP